MQKIIAISLALSPGVALGDASSYSDNRIVERYRDEACSVMIDDIETVIPTEFEPGESLEQFGDRFAEAVGRKGTGLGFILGYDTASGGLHGNGETTLQRLRQACEKEPEMTALSILEGFAAQ